jgi:hypothetical protein
MELIPFIPSKAITVNQLAIEVTTLLAASNCLAAIYSSNANGSPNALLVTTTNLDCATTGVKALSITSTALTAGTLYYIAVMFSSTQTLRGIAVAACLPVAQAASGTAVPTVVRATQTYASGMPSTAPAGTSTSTIVPWVRMQLA